MKYSRSFHQITVLAWFPNIDFYLVCEIFPLLFPISFTISSLFNFCNLKLYFFTIFLFIRIPVVLLSKSTLTVMPSCVSTFSILIFYYTFLNILNILLISLWLSSSFAALFGTPVHMLLCCVFASMGHATSSQFHYDFFCPVLYSEHRIFLLFCSIILPPIVSLLLYSIHCTLIISLLLASFSL